MFSNVYFNFNMFIVINQLIMFIENRKKVIFFKGGTGVTPVPVRYLSYL